MNQQRVFAYILWFQKEVFVSIQSVILKGVWIEKFPRIILLLHICDSVTMSLDVTEATLSAKDLAHFFSQEEGSFSVRFLR
jgi:hypothetical protein